MVGNLSGWLADVRDTMDNGGTLYGLKLGVYYCFVGLWLTVNTRLSLDTTIYERDWDLLVVLDTCRTDALAAVADEYDFLDSPASVRSPGSTSAEWVARVFDRQYADEIADTVYVTANPHSEEVLRHRLMPPQYVDVPFAWPAWDPVDPDAFATLDEVWSYAHDDRLGVVPPATVTDRTIAASRDGDADRVVAHYMQPHVPYIAEAVETGDAVSEISENPFERLRRGEIPRETVWEAYLDNLRLVLDEVADLLENVDAERVVLTADHGEAFGELGFYEHPVGCPHPVVKRVPWYETTAVDRGTRDPDPVDTDAGDRDVAAQLRDLGYV